MSLLDHALAHAANGFRVFPLVPDRTARRSCDYNIGVACGEFVVIEYSGRKGMAALRQHHLRNALLGIGETYRVRTPDGEQVLYRVNHTIPSGESGIAIAPGVTLFGEGGYVVGAGSSIEGQLYESITALRPIAQLAPLPWWLAEAARKASPPGATVLPLVRR